MMKLFDLWKKLRIIVFLLPLGICVFLMADKGYGQNRRYAPGEMIVKVNHGIAPSLNSAGAVVFGLPSVDRLNREWGAKNFKRVFRNPIFSNYYILEFERGEGLDMEFAAGRYAKDSQVLYAGPNYYAKFVITGEEKLIPDDPFFENQWGLNNTGQSGGSPDADIDAVEAWEIETGSSAVVIAILDTGIDLVHPDMSGKIWINGGEVPGNDIDDDGNGFVDDVNGWDFINEDADPQDDNSHGTHTSGIAGSASNNGEGIAGVCWGCSLMPVKVLGSDGIGTYAQISAGIEYAADNGADVINLSLGSETYSEPLENIIGYAHDNGCVIIGAAGNFNDDDPFYPAAFDHVLAAAALDHNDVKYQLSGYGDWIDLSAPGVDITSAVLHEGYSSWSGTSMAAPFISGTAGLLFSAFPSWNNLLIESHMLHLADDVDNANPGYAGLLGKGRINSFNCLSVSPEPDLHLIETSIDDSASPADGDGALDPDETANLIVTLYNSWGDAVSVSGTIESSHPHLSITDNYGTFGDIASQLFTENNADPFELHLNDSCPAGQSIDINLILQDSLSNLWEFPFTLITGSREYSVPVFINSDTTWEENETYLVNHNVLVQAKLTVEPGVTVKIDPGSAIVFRDNGFIEAVGTETQPITFTSSNPPNKWICLKFEDNSHSHINDLKYCILEYAEMPVNDETNRNNMYFEYNKTENCLQVGYMKTSALKNNEFIDSGRLSLVLFPTLTSQNEFNVADNLFINSYLELQIQNDNSTGDVILINDNYCDGGDLYGGTCSSEPSLYLFESNVVMNGDEGISGSLNMKPRATKNTVINCSIGIRRVFEADHNLISNCDEGLDGCILVHHNHVEKCNNGIKYQYFSGARGHREDGYDLKRRSASSKPDINYLYTGGSFVRSRNMRFLHEDQAQYDSSFMKKNRSSGDHSENENTKTSVTTAAEKSAESSTIELYCLFAMTPTATPTTSYSSRFTPSPSAVYKTGRIMTPSVTPVSSAVNTPIPTVVSTSTPTITLTRTPTGTWTRTPTRTATPTYTPVIVGDYVWNDENEDGEQNEDWETAGINGVLMEIYEDTNDNNELDQGDILLDSATTQNDPVSGYPGWYNLSAYMIPNNRYFVNIDPDTLPPFYFYTAKTSPYDFHFNAGTHYDYIDFGLTYRGWANNNIIACRNQGISAYFEGYDYQGNNYIQNEQYCFKNQKPANAAVQYSYWGFAATAEMNEENEWPQADSDIEAIYDFLDDFDLGFADYSYWLTEPNPEAPGFLWNIVLDPPSPVGAELVLFTLSFSSAMDMESELTVTFGVDEPFDEHQITGDWENQQTWSGSFLIDYFTGDGQNTISASGGKDASGLLMPADTNHSFIIETGIGGVQGLAAVPIDAGMILSWQPNYEPDLAGYRLYYDIDSGVPYNGTGASQGSSPIDVGNVNNFALTDLINGQIYYFAVRAVDAGDHLGPYSSEVWGMPNGASTPAPTQTPCQSIPATGFRGIIGIIAILGFLISLSGRKRSSSQGWN